MNTTKKRTAKVARVVKKVTKATKVVKVKAVKAKVAPTTKRNSNSINSLENGISILRYAIKNRVCMATASNANDKGRNYISDIKARLEENYKSKNISKDLYTTFKYLNKEYIKAVK